MQIDTQDAERRALIRLLDMRGASYLYAADGRTRVAQALCDPSPMFLHNVTNELREGYIRHHDDAELGRMVRARVEGYLRTLPEFYAEVDRQIAAMREDAEAMAAADDEFEAST